MKNHIVSISFLLLVGCINTTSEGNNLTENSSPNKNLLRVTVKNNSTLYHSNKQKSRLSENYKNIPEWYLRNRVQIHTRLSIKEVNSPIFFGFPENLAKYPGAGVLTRQIKSGGEEIWWPSSTGTLNPAAAKYPNLAKKIIDQLHDLNMKSIVYHWHTADQDIFEAHPDWASRDINNNLLQSARGYYLCINSPYRDILIKRLSELASFGADGLFFDELHMPVKGCFCENCQRLYKEKYGRDLVQDFKDRKTLDFYEFRNESIKRFFDDLRSNLDEKQEHPILIVSGNNWPNLTGLHLNSNVFHDFILKSELSIPLKSTTVRTPFSMPANVQAETTAFYINAFYFSFMRDNSYGPPHIWCPRLVQPKEINQTAAGLISLGCVANIDIDATKANMDSFKEAIFLNKKYGDYFAKLTPYASIGILVSENERNKFFGQPQKAWDNVLGPALLTFQSLYKAGIPVQLISDASFDQDNIDNLSKIYCNTDLTSLGSFKGESAKKFENFPSSASKQKELNLALSVNSPIFCEKSNENYHINYFKDNAGYLYIAGAPDFTADIHEVNDNVKTKIANLAAQESLSNNYNLKIYISKRFIASGSIEDITNNKNVQYSGESNGYYVFEVTCNDESLRLLRFKLSNN